MKLFKALEGYRTQFLTILYLVLQILADEGVIPESIMPYITKICVALGALTLSAKFGREKKPKKKRTKK